VTTATTADSTPTAKLYRLAVPLLGLMAGIQSADPNIASTALVSASKSLTMAGSTQALAASISTLALAATVISTGLLADRLGRRRVLAAGLILAIAGDLIVAASPATITFLGGRLIAGIGLGAVYGAAFGYLSAVTTPKTLPGALGVFGAVTGLTVLLMSFIGGSLVAVDWRVAYLLVPALSGVALLVTPMILPKVPIVTGEKQDLPGQLLLIVAVAGTLLGISRLGDGLTKPSFFVPTILGIVAFIVFFINQSRSASRFFPVSLFRNPIFIAAVLIGAAFNFSQSMAFLQLTNLWQYVTEVTSSAIAAWQLPFNVAGVVGALFIGRRLQRGLPTQTVALLGTILSPLGFVAIAIAAGSKSFFAFVPGAVLLGLGIIFLAVIYGGLIIREAPPEHFGPVTSSRTTIGAFFYSIGLAISSLAIDRLTLGGTKGRLEAAGVPPTQLGTALDPVTVFYKSGTDPSTEAGRAALADAQDSYITSFQTVMGGAAVLVFVAGFVSYVLLKRNLAAPAAPAAPTPPAAAAASS